VLKKLSLLASIVYTLTLSALSLIRLDEVAVKLPSFNDKVAHALAHFILVALWFVVFRFRFNNNYNKAIGFAALFSLGYGILIELLQGWITVSRQSDYNDVFANTLGMIFAVIIILCVKTRVKKL
jgi:VanZ family protein